MNCTRKNTSVQPLYSIACKETRGGGMVIHCKTSPTPAFTSQQQRAAPGEYPASASPRCTGSAHAQAQPPWIKGSVVSRELRGAGGTSQAGAGITLPREQRSAPSPCPRNPDRAAPLPFTAAPPDLWPRDHAETLGRCWERQQLRKAVKHLAPRPKQELGDTKLTPKHIPRAEEADGDPGCQQDMGSAPPAALHGPDFNLLVC